MVQSDPCFGGCKHEPEAEIEKGLRVTDDVALAQPSPEYKKYSTGNIRAHTYCDQSPTYMHINILTYTHSHTHPNMDIYTHAHVHIHTNSQKHPRMYTRIRTYAQSHTNMT